MVNKSGILKCFFAAAVLFLSNAAADDIDNYLASLSEADAAAQMFLVNIEGNSSYSAVEEIDGSPLVPGGCILFSFNIAPSAEQIISYTSSVASYCKKNNKPVPYIAIDQEGGLVNRLRDITSPLPSESRLAARVSPSSAAEIYSAQARQLRALGITMNLAPVAEPSVESNKDFLGTRSFGSVANACVYSFVAINAYEKNGVGSVLKHFPGNTNTDPHTGLPFIELSLKELKENFIVPFAFALESSPSAVLMSHAVTKVVDSKTPACLSEYWTREVLQKQLGYGGFIISDDIFMKALADNGFPPEKAVLMAVRAGVDVIMLSEKKFANVVSILLSYAHADKFFSESLKKSQRKIIEFKLLKGILKRQNGKIVSAQAVDSEQSVRDFYSAKREGDELYRQLFLNGDLNEKK